MNSDYVWPSVYFSYLFFAILFGLAAYFCLRTEARRLLGRAERGR